MLPRFPRSLKKTVQQHQLRLASGPVPHEFVQEMQFPAIIGTGFASRRVIGVQRLADRSLQMNRKLLQIRLEVRFVMLQDMAEQFPDMAPVVKREMVEIILKIF